MLRYKTPTPSTILEIGWESSLFGHMTDFGLVSTSCLGWVMLVVYSVHFKNLFVIEVDLILPLSLIIPFKEITLQSDEIKFIAKGLCKFTSLNPLFCWIHVYFNQN